MKLFKFTLIIFLIAAGLWSVIGMKSANKEEYISPMTLDIARPVNVTIDIDFIKGLNPANGK